MNTWESFFQQKSERRARARSYRVTVRWAIAALGFLVLVIASIAGVNAALERFDQFAQLARGR